MERKKKILAVDCFSVLKIINENYPTCIPKNWCHDLASRLNCLRLLWSRFCPVSPLFWLFLRFRCEVIAPCFIHVYESMWKIGFIAVQQRQTLNTILWIFFTISIMVTSFGRSLRCSSWELVRPRLNSAIQYFIVGNEEVDSPRVESSSTLILVGLRPSIVSIVSHNYGQFFPCSQIYRERSLLIAGKQIINNLASSNF